MSKTFKTIFVVVFFVICTAPLVLMPFFKNDVSLEKRELNPFPSYIEDGKINRSFSDGFEAWYNDRLPFRAQILTAANFLKGEELHSPTSNVIIGKEGWLYYVQEGEDYMATNVMTEEEAGAFAITLSLIQENIEGRGGNFTFVPMSNKASVYGEYMPSCYRKADRNNLSMVTEEMKKAGVNFVDMKNVLTSNKDKGVLYHRRDSHWNYLGALYGFDAIMESLGRDHRDYDKESYDMVKTWRGDLDKLIYPAGGVMDYQYEFDFEHCDFVFTDPRGVRDSEEQLAIFMSDREEGDDQFSTKNRELSDGSSIYMARDSFGRALLPYVIDSYENATFKRTDCPNVQSIEDGSDMVYEIGERNLRKIIAKAPFMFAPERDSSYSDGKTASGETKISYKSEGYGSHIYGALPGDFDIKDGRVYIEISGEGASRVYEAFPILESELSGQGETRGFSAYFSKDTLPEGEYDIKIIAGDMVFDGGRIDL